MAGDFLDSNILIYAFSNDRRAAGARTLLLDTPKMNSHALVEFTNIARRKLLMTWSEVREALGIITAVAGEILPIGLDTHSAAVRIAERYRYSIFDALMVASALQAGSKTLWSEDMQDGMRIDGRLVIRNPF